MLFFFKRFAILLVTLLLSLCFAYAQQTQETKGTVYRKISNDRLAGVIVTNKKNKAMAMSDDQGNFSIKSSVGDSLLFTKADYTPEYQVATGYSTVVYLQPELKLGEVVIRGQTKKQELNEVLGTYRKKGLYFDGKPPVTTFLPIGGSPLTGLYELFGKDARNMRRFAAFTKREVEATEVDRRYNKPLVMRVTGLTDTAAVQKFMEYYRPSFEDLKIWADYDLMKHIKTNYEYYRKNGDKVNLQKLY